MGQVHLGAGDFIDFYNIRYNCEGTTTYESYDGIFVQSNGEYQNTAIKQLIDIGIPSYKLVINKVLIQSEAGWVPTSDLGAWTSEAFTRIGWFAGVGHKFFSHDQAGAHILESSGNLMESFINTQI